MDGVLFLALPRSTGRRCVNAEGKVNLTAALLASSLCNLYMGLSFYLSVCAACRHAGKLMRPDMCSTFFLSLGTSKAKCRQANRLIVVSFPAIKHKHRQTHGRMHGPGGGGQIKCHNLFPAESLLRKERKLFCSHGK